MMVVQQDVATAKNEPPSKSSDKLDGGDVDGMVERTDVTTSQLEKKDNGRFAGGEQKRWNGWL